MEKLHYERADYSVVVKNRAAPPKAWRWEIYRAGNANPIKRSSIYFDTTVAARQAGKDALKRAGHEYEAYSATRKQYDAFVEQISKMWANQPNRTDAQVGTITAPVLVLDGDHDEAIKREHTEYIASTIPHAGLLILPNASHFAFLQDPRMFNYAVLHFLGDR